MELHHHFSHQHPLEFIQEHNLDSGKANCSGCGEQVSGPSYSCTECEFYLDKKCFEASSEVNNPFHPNHSLKLLASPPYIGSWAICAFCDKICENFVYHCSCKLDLHVKCALFSKTIAENKIRELEGVSQKDLLVSSKNGSEELEETECFACRKPLLDSPFISFDSRFHLHKRCLDLPIEVNHLFHSQHPLVLQFNSQRLPCQICRITQPRGLVYCCSTCEFAIHIACVERPTRINHPCAQISDSPTCQGHEHRLFFYEKYEGQCNGCGWNLRGAYACKECNFAVGYECLSLPDKIQHKCDEHPLMLTYGEDNSYSEYHYCDICEKGRNPSRWFYRCAICDSSVHRLCAIDAYSYMKLGKTYTSKDHPHPLTFTRKVYDYPPECRHICEEHCEDLSAEGLENGCNYIVHWNCRDPYRKDILRWWPKEKDKEAHE